MTGRVRVEAPAKINLHLDVRGRRSDGYHDILSLFQAVSLTDTLTVRSLKESDTIEIEGDFGCSPEVTTVHRAAVDFREATGIRDGVAISVQKRIPAGAGLGGGSSDAAAALIALCELFQQTIDRDSLESLGSSIGSDVPFFFASGAALVSGRGDIVQAITARDDLWIVLVFPGFPVSTATAYALLDENRSGSAREGLDPKAIESRYRLHPSTWGFSNSFEPCIGAEHPEIGSWRRRLDELGAAFSSMSGSGSSVYGVFEDKEPAERAAAALRAEAPWTFAARSLARPIAVD